MNDRVKKLLVGFLTAMLMLLGALTAKAQAPAGPQNGGQQKASPPPTAQQQQAPPQKKPEESGLSISVEVPIVTLDVIATTQHGDILTGLKKENFKVVEDGVPQTVTNFGPSEAPITIVMLMEFSSRGYEYYAYLGRMWALGFLPHLKKDDWVALITFDMRPKLEVDFTQNKQEVEEAVQHLYFPGFHESNLFDAILDTVDRLKDVKGKKSILVLASGVDTFSKHTLDQTIKQLRQTDTTIFAVGVGRPLNNYVEAHGGGNAGLTYLQGENQLKTFAQMTGGYAWFPQFDGEIPGISQDVTAYLRNQYSLSYTPTNREQNGKFRKIKVELVQPDGTPLMILDKKGKKQKVVVYAREGYQPPKGGVGD
jgi:VWFA-related protein